MICNDTTELNIFTFGVIFYLSVLPFTICGNVYNSINYVMMYLFDT